MTTTQSSAPAPAAAKAVAAATPQQMAQVRAGGPVSLTDVMIRWWKLVVYGAPGVGKSILAATSRKYKTFVFDVDGQGIASVKAYVIKHKLEWVEANVKVWPVSSIDDFMRGWQWLFAHRGEFQLVVFDSATEYQAMQRRKAFSSSAADPRQNWGVVLDAMDLVTSNFKDMQWHFICVCHETMKEDPVLARPQFRPAFQGDWKYQYARHFGVICRYTTWFAKQKVNINGKEQVADVVQRWLDCGPNPLIHYKDRSGILNRWEPANIDSLLDKLILSQQGQEGLDAAVSQSANEQQPEDPGEAALNAQAQQQDTE